jgi:RNA polymerase primary sigma factor
VVDQAAIRRALTNTVKSVRVPSYMAELISRWRVVSQELAFRSARRRASRRSRASSASPRRLAAAEATIHDRGRPAGLARRLTARRTRSRTSARTRPRKRCSTRISSAQLSELLDVIDEREATILRLRYGLGESAER